MPNLGLLLKSIKAWHTSDDATRVFDKNEQNYPHKYQSSFIF